MIKVDHPANNDRLSVDSFPRDGSVELATEGILTKNADIKSPGFRGPFRELSEVVNIRSFDRVLRRPLLCHHKAGTQHPEACNCHAKPRACSASPIHGRSVS